MSVRNVVRVVLKLCILVCSVVGLLLQMGVFSGAAVADPFYTYTGLITVFVGLYELVTVVEMFRSKGKKNFVSAWQYAALVGALCSMGLARYTGNTTAEGHAGTALFLMNSLIPAAMFIEWLFLTPKGSFKDGYPWLGCLPAYLYMLAIAIGPSTGLPFASYGILDIVSLGIINGTLRFVVLTMLMLGCGYFIQSLDSFFSKKHIL